MQSLLKNSEFFSICLFVLDFIFDFVHNSKSICSFMFIFPIQSLWRTFMKLDPIDARIIKMLQDDGRRSYAEIAEEVESKTSLVIATILASGKYLHIRSV